MYYPITSGSLRKYFGFFLALAQEVNLLDPITYATNCSTNSSK
ncbi:hypothetical protein AQBE111736_12675 [Aquirufa beregesia]